MRRTIGDLLAEVPEGQSRSFKADHSGAFENRFVEVAYNWEYGTTPSWNNRPSLLDLPWMGSRAKSRVGLDKIAEPNLTYKRPSAQLVDFYSTGTGATLISDRLLEVFERLDPGSLEIRKVVMNARDGQVPFNMVMPVRLLEAIDVSYCDVDVVAESLGPQWIQIINFPNGVIFDHFIDQYVQNFSDIDLRNRWFWSCEIFKKVKDCGIRGVVARSPGGRASQQIDQM